MAIPRRWFRFPFFFDRFRFFDCSSEESRTCLPVGVALERNLHILFLRDPHQDVDEFDLLDR